MKRTLVLAVELLLLVLTGAATPQAVAAPPSSGVTLEKIMSDPDWIGTPPEDPYWADDSQTVYFERKRTGEAVKDLYRLELDAAKGGAPVRVADEERGKVDVAAGDLSEDRAWKVYARQGDLYLKDLRTGAIRQLTRTADVETAPRFLAGDTRISFRRGSSVYLYELPTSLISQPAELRLEKDPKEAEKKEKSFLEEEQLELFDVLKRRKRDREGLRDAAEAEQKADPTRAPLPWYLGEGIEIVQASLSPSGDWMIVATRPKEVDEGKPSPMADFVTESGYVEAREVRSKVGTGKPVSPTILLLDLKAHVKHEIDLAALAGFKDDPLKELREKAAARKAKEEDKDGKDAKDGKDG
ncbi:MAG: hypothetical protein ABUL63_00230, partial [Acidobacteriota bacterium]